MGWILWNTISAPNTNCDTALVEITVVNDPCDPLDIANITSPGGSHASRSLDLSANPAAVGFTGTWSIQSGASGSESFLNINSETTTVSNLTPGETYIFRWTVTCDTDGSSTSFEEVTYCILTTEGLILMRQ